MIKSQSYEISHIYKNIYISDIKNACDITQLKKNNIKAILYLGINQKSDDILNEYKKNNIKHKFLQISDTEKSSISDCFEPSWIFINKYINEPYNILIHCVKGVSRSPTIVTYYLTRKLQERMKDKGYIEYVVDDIIELIQFSRPCANPNKNFIQQLKNYEIIKIQSLQCNNA